MTFQMETYRATEAPKPLVVPLVAGFRMVGVGRSTGYKLIDTDPAFPKPIECSPGRKGLIVAELEAWVASRASRRNMVEAA
ncbi:helix-turn-helix transcriptional regulator [Acuticoccus mangrovi]|uniref:AlpA family phage regulatory protein n=1 Tax=Acuticoccus mangrovi TaxID=2796142 RepID=A0A934MIG0_9HYPH|nr:AlpA family phage regulatory protein [Acuticoccus mangrovi]MBJ3777880.1 hypothetical protein [Acuticoccus mangrovi]